MRKVPFSIWESKKWWGQNEHLELEQKETPQNQVPVLNCRGEESV